MSDFNPNIITSIEVKPEIHDLKNKDLHQYLKKIGQSWIKMANAQVLEELKERDLILNSAKPF